MCGSEKTNNLTENERTKMGGYIEQFVERGHIFKYCRTVGEKSGDLHKSWVKLKRNLII